MRAQILVRARAKSIVEDEIREVVRHRSGHLQGDSQVHCAATAAMGLLSKETSHV